VKRRSSEQQRGRPVASILLIVLLVTVSACASGGHSPNLPSPRPPTAPPTTEPSGPAIRSLDLRKGTYRVPCPLGGGPMEVHPSQPTSPTPAGSVVIDGFRPVFGDVTGNGHDDAVIAVNCAAQGGNTVTSSIVLVVSEPGGLRQMGPAIDGYEPVIAGSRVGVARAVYAPADPRCCPSSVRYMPLTFGSGRLTDSPATRAPSLGTAATTTGIGALQVGRRYVALAAGTGRSILVSGAPAASNGCASVTVEGGPSAITGLGDLDRLRTITITDPAVRFRPGVGVGATEAQVERAFPGQVQPNPAQYVAGGGSSVYAPTAAPGHVAVFDTEGDKIARYRVGDANWAPVSSCR
jgi:hypothetical protein